MAYLSPDLRRALFEALEAFGAVQTGTTAFAKWWKAVGNVEDYAAIATTPAGRVLVELMRRRLETELRKSAPNDALHEHARSVGEFLKSPPWRKRR